ncbi:response regulator [Sphingomonas humi]|uniref:Response regulator n=1 Tax=Sphingomonas humi TaxID=335630 RepID=A0ABP7SEE9_9SPHN
MSHHIAVVDDEEDLRDAIASYLRGHGYAVSEASGGAGLDAVMREKPVDLVVLDVNMPGEDGLSIARRLRAAGSIGIVMLTAQGALVDRIVGLETGADDYLPKPFELRELLARVRAVLRRSGVPSATGVPRREVGFGRCILDLEARTLRTRQGEPVPITAMEFDLLKLFADHPGKVLSRDQILNHAHNRDLEPFDRSVDLRIARLRRKVEEDPAKPDALKTVRGAGYLFSPRH